MESWVLESGTLYCIPHLHRCRGQHLSAGGRIWRAECWSPVHAPLQALSPAGQKMFSLRQDSTSLQQLGDSQTKQLLYIRSSRIFSNIRERMIFVLLNAYFVKEDRCLHKIFRRSQFWTKVSVTL